MIGAHARADRFRQSLRASNASGVPDHRSGTCRDGGSCPGSSLRNVPGWGVVSGIVVPERSGMGSRVRDRHPQTFRNAKTAVEPRSRRTEGRPARTGARFSPSLEWSRPSINGDRSAAAPILRTREKSSKPSFRTPPPPTLILPLYKGGPPRGSSPGEFNKAGTTASPIPFIERLMCAYVVRRRACAWLLLILSSRLRRGPSPSQS